MGIENLPIKPKGRIAVFLSGRGSNFEALHRHSLQKEANYEIIVVISDKKEARGLAVARSQNIKTFHISPKKFKSKEIYEREIIKVLKAERVDLICLAGYMRIVGTELLNAYQQKILNIHPALLPSFPGLHGQKQALDYGAKVSGCTVHFVDSGVDTGPIILQKAVMIEENDNEDTLGARILKEEHKLFAKAVALFFDKKLKISERRVIILD